MKFLLILITITKFATTFTLCKDRPSGCNEPLQPLACGVNFDKGEYIRTNFKNSCEACSSILNVTFTVPGKCHLYHPTALFCMPGLNYTENDTEENQNSNNQEVCGWGLKKFKNNNRITFSYAVLIKAISVYEACQFQYVTQFTYGPCEIIPNNL